MQPRVSKPKSKPVTVRLTMWSARHRWLVVGVWFLVIIAIFGTGTAMGTKTFSNDDDTNGAKPESSQAWTVYDAGNKKVVTNDSSETVMVVISHPTLKSGDAAYKEVVTKIEDSLKNSTYKDGSKTFANLTDPYTAGLFAGLVSSDNSALRVNATIQGDNKLVSQKLQAVKPLLNDLGTPYKDFNIHVYNNTLLNDQAYDLVNQSLDSSLLITLPLSFVILLFAFGAIAAAFVPLVLAITSLMAAFGFLGIYSNTVTKVDPSASQLIVLIGLAVSVDYSLFFITRYRTERRHGRDKMAALEVASSTAGRAVFFSGITVMISLAGLFFLPSATFTSMAAGTIAVVFMSVVGSLTFLPALLSILGKGVNWGRIPYIGRDREEGSGFWGHLVSAVMRHPIVSAGITLVLLLALATPFLHLKMGNNSIDGLPDSLDAVQAYHMLNAKWPQGTTLIMNVIVTQADRADTKAAIDKFKDAAVNQVKGLSGPKVQNNNNGSAANISFYMNGSRNDQVNEDAVNQVRHQIIPANFGNLPDVKAYVAGGTAYTMDTVKTYTDAMPTVFGFVLGMSFLLLLIAFHSLIIPIKAILLNLLSTAASYGVMVLVFQDGYLSQLIGFKPTGVIEAFVPIFVFTILFGLSMDYHLFILTRIKENKDRGMSSNEAVARGISATSGTITSAAAIMVAVFAVFVTLPIIIVRQLGLGLAVAVLIDASIIRSILLPATMRLLGDWNWWLPKFLDWIPQITVEGEPEAEAIQPAPPALVKV